MKLQRMSPKTHRYMDWGVIAAYALAPRLLGFSKRAAITMYILTAYHAVLTLLTERPIGQADVIPTRVHGHFESATPATLAALPWAARFSEDNTGRNFFLGSAAAVLLTRLSTNYRNRPHAKAAA
jgi:hypothetical protein